MKRWNLWVAALFIAVALTPLLVLGVARTSLGGMRTTMIVAFVAAGGLLACAGFAALALRRAPPEARQRSVWGPVLQLTLIPGLYLSVMLGMGVSRGGSLLVAFLSALPMTLMFAGFGAFGLAVRRSGEGRYCAKCGYEQSEHALASPKDHPLCAECGEDWHRPRGVVIGQRKVRKWLIAVGVLMVISPFVVTLGPLAGLMTSQAMLRFLPTASLIQEIAGAPRGFVMDEWAVLKTRQLTPAQSAHFASSLLDRRLRTGYLDRDSEVWLVTQETTGALAATPALRERLFAESVEVSIDAPSSVRAGDPATVRLSTLSRGGVVGPAWPMPYIVFAGYTTRPEGADLARRDAVLASGFGRTIRYINTGSPGQSPETAFTMPARGPARIVAEYWLVYATPGPMSAPIQWNTDGTPVLPAGVVWAQRRKLEHQFSVAP